MVEAFPLQWPVGHPRSKRPERARFDNKISESTTRTFLLDELRKMKAKNIVISTNKPTRKDGMYYASAREPDDSGVAVYFERKGEQKCFSCDKYRSIRENLRAIALTIQSLRGIERWGTGDMVDAAFKGFAALPSPEMFANPPWWEVLTCNESDSMETVRSKYLELASSHHPDKGGDHDSFVRIQDAWTRFKAEQNK